MRLLLDTHLLLWAGEFETPSTSRLSALAIELISKDANDLFFSAASIWEVAIKSALGRPDFTADPRRFRRCLVANGYVELPVTSEHAVGVAQLPLLHRDPFDRILIAQASIEGVTLLTADAKIAAYGDPVLRV